MSESLPQKVLRRYMHSLLRLRHRYGVEITIERYEQLCSDLAEGKGEGRRTNEKGELEAWIEVEPGVWACACFDGREQLIRTFMPAPPERVDVSPHEQVRLVRAENKTLRGQIERLQRQLAGLSGEDASAGELLQLRAQAALTGIRGEDVTWFKQRIYEARGLIAEGRYLDAAVLLDAAGSLKKSDHPGADPERFAEVVAERSQQIRPHWEQLFSYLGTQARKGAA